MQAIGEVDELNAYVGVVISLMPTQFITEKEKLTRVQHKLFNVGANLAAVQTDLISVPKLLPQDIAGLEHWIDEMTAELEPLTQFILPGGSHIAAECFYARAICRRAERELVGLGLHYELDPLLAQYLNRLSDALFVLGRWMNKKQNILDVNWEK